MSVNSAEQAIHWPVFRRRVAGKHLVSVNYSGDNNFNSSTTSMTQMVNPGSTTATLTSSANTSTYGQPVMFTFVAFSPSPIAKATGTVTISSDGGQAVVPLIGGMAIYPTSQLTPGPHTITAVFNGDNNFAGCSASTTQMVNKASTSIAVSSSPNPSLVGQGVTFTATVSLTAPGAGDPSHGGSVSVSFLDGTTLISSNSLTISPGGNTATASCTTSILGVGTTLLRPSTRAMVTSTGAHRTL